MKKYIFWLGVAICFGACSSPEYLSKPMNFKYHVKGLFIEIFTGKNKLTGEIIAVNEKSMILLPLSNYDQGDARSGNVKSDVIKPYMPNSALVTVLKDSIQKAVIIVATTSDDPKKISTGASFINFASIGHGFWGIVTLPLNLVITISIANDAAKGAYKVKYPELITWSEMSKFARFPQGLPRNINPRDIK